MRVSASTSIKTAIAAALAAVSATGAEVASQAAAPATALTIYSNAAPGSISPDAYRSPVRGAVPGYAVVRQQRDLNLTTRPQRRALHPMWRPSSIPTTVMFESLTDPAGTTVLEQNFQFDLVDQPSCCKSTSIRPSKSIRYAATQSNRSKARCCRRTGGITLKREDGTMQLLPHQCRHYAAEPARRPDYAPDAGVEYECETGGQSSHVACHTRRPA